jgi:hypothetical protein
MKYCIVDPVAFTVKTVECGTAHQAYKMAGLDPMRVDHGTVFVADDGSGIAIVVFEFGLFVPPEEGHYFSIGERLYVGGAVLYAYDGQGETIDIPQVPPVMFYKSHAEVERAIHRGEIIRPVMAVNNKVIWQWPEKRKP